MSSVFARIADKAHIGSVLGLWSFLGYQVYQTGRNVLEARVDNKYQYTKIFKKIDEKVKEEEQDKQNFNSIPDRYDADDNSYLKKVPNLQEPDNKN
jgi:predicted negative regulator of RcsB-dependent stress response